MAFEQLREYGGVCLSNSSQTATSNAFVDASVGVGGVVGVPPFEYQGGVAGVVQTAAPVDLGAVASIGSGIPGGGAPITGTAGTGLAGG